MGISVNDVEPFTQARSSLPELADQTKKVQTRSLPQTAKAMWR